VSNRRVPDSARIAAAIAAALLSAALLSAPAVADTKSQLAAAKAKLNRLLDRISVAQDAMDALNAQANELAAQIDAVQTRIARVQGQMAKVQGQVAEANKELGATQEQLDRRAWVAFENGPGYSLEVLLSSTSLSELTDRLAVVDAAAASDRQLIEQIQAMEAKLRVRQEKLTALQMDLKGEQKELAGKQKDLRDKQAGIQQSLAQMDSDKAEAAGLVNQLEKKRAAEIEAEKRRLAALRVTASHGGSSISGVFLVCPVDQPRAYYDDFGAPRYAGGYHPHAGNDIVAPIGTPIRAPFSGSATDASNSFGGVSVKVYGPQGYVYNAHLSRIGQLGSVSTGDIIGYVGDSGDAKGGIAHDHFEWHPNVIPSDPYKSYYGYTVIGTAIDPFPYLNSVC
jgi:peptidoglycan hydrolase CwlO-like protein